MGSWHIISKDLRLLARDRNAVLALLVMPLVVSGIICFSITEWVANENNRQLRLAVVDADQTAASRQLIQRLSIHPSARTKLVAEPSSVLRLSKHDWTAVVVIGKGFEASLGELEALDLVDLPRGRLSRGLSGFGISVESRTLRQVDGLLATQYVTANLIHLVYDTEVHRFPLISTLVSSHREKGAAPSPAPVSLGPGSLSVQDIYQIMVPAQAVLFAFFLVSVMSRSFMAERLQGTLQRLHLAPISMPVIVLGKTTPFFLVSSVQGLLLFGSAKIFYDVSLGENPWLIVPVVLCTSIAATGLGFLVGVASETDYQVNVLATFMILVMAAISGCLMPRGILPPILVQVSKAVTPHAWALSAYDEVLAQSVPDMALILMCCAALVLFGTGFLCLGIWRGAHSLVSGEV